MDNAFATKCNAIVVTSWDVPMYIRTNDGWHGLGAGYIDYDSEDSAILNRAAADGAHNSDAGVIGVYECSLDGLLEALRNHRFDGKTMCSLPTFGGTEPSSTVCILSWDEDRLLVGTCCDDFSIIDRDEMEEQA